MDGLTLREHIRVLLVARLGWSKPLKSRAVFRCRHFNAQLEVVAVGLGHSNGERTAVGLYSGGGQIVFEFARASFDAGDLEIARSSISHGCKPQYSA